MKKIGILGGTFDPIHNGHLMMADIACEQYDLDKIWFMPTGNPPHKASEEITSDRHRCNMIELAISDDDRFWLDKTELDTEEKVYTYKTLEKLGESCEDVEFYFIMGADSLFYFDKWRKPERISELCVILVAVRDDMDRGVLANKILELEKKFNSDIRIIDTPNFSVSSRDIRSRIKKGHSVKYMMPERVRDYAAQNGLYNTDGAGSCDKKEQPVYGDERFLQILGLLKERLDDERYLHTVGVMYTAGALAYVHAPELLNKALIAGLLHDCAKCIPKDERYELCSEYNISLNEAERSNPGLVHAKLGARLALEIYGVYDEDIRHAISVHTTGCPGMSTLDKIVYLADFIEPLRDKENIPVMERARKLSFESLDRAVGLVAERTIAHLKAKGAVIDDTTAKTAEYYTEGK